MILQYQLSSVIHLAIALRLAIGLRWWFRVLMVFASILLTKYVDGNRAQQHAERVDPAKTAAILVSNFPELKGRY
jgi:hypothetical protein